MMQQRFPLLILAGFPEPYGMILKISPLHKQQVFMIILQAMLQLMAQIAFYRRNEYGRCLEALLKLAGESRLDLQHGCFQYHCNPLLARMYSPDASACKCIPEKLVIKINNDQQHRQRLIDTAHFECIIGVINPVHPQILLSVKPGGMLFREGRVAAAVDDAAPALPQQRE
ncbi:hypothetical protein D3C73_788410 [compost metagenome]